MVPLFSIFRYSRWSYKAVILIKRSINDIRFFLSSPFCVCWVNGDISNILTRLTSSKNRKKAREKKNSIIKETCREIVTSFLKNFFCNFTFFQKKSNFKWIIVTLPKVWTYVKQNKKKNREKKTGKKNSISNIHPKFDHILIPACTLLFQAWWGYRVVCLGWNWLSDSPQLCRRTSSSIWQV